jgi:hypothetical protein
VHLPEPDVRGHECLPPDCGARVEQRDLHP